MRNKQLDSVRDFVVRLMIDERDRHAELLGNLRSQISINSFTGATMDMLSEVHNARIKTLELVLSKIKEA